MKYLRTLTTSAFYNGTRGRRSDVVEQIAQHPPTDLACPIISFHEQVLGCHTYISQARRAEDVVRGYGMLDQVLRGFRRGLGSSRSMQRRQWSSRAVTQRIRIETMDLRIAAIALSREMVFGDAECSDFRKVPGFRIEDWTV